MAYDAGGDATRVTGVIDMPLWLRLTLLGVALGCIPVLVLAHHAAEWAGHWWRWSYTASALRCRMRAVGSRRRRGKDR